jgi:hypothetical protein
MNGEIETCKMLFNGYRITSRMPWISQLMDPLSEDYSKLNDIEKQLK